MTSYIYPSAFSSAPVSSSQSISTATTSNPIATPQFSTQTDSPAPSQGLASFITHVAFLDDKLQRGDRSAFFAAHRARIVSRKRVGNGVSFIVERAELEGSGAGSAAEPSQKETPSPTVVAMKTVREDRQHDNQWGEVLLEIRALLHEPIRYHPNIVRLLDIRWDTSTETGSPFPAIVQEFAVYGTLDKLQKGSTPLPFGIKQKLCYDVGRGLSIIHACGMVHGDLKHENVLVFPNPYPDPPNQPYIAKLADFGGTLMDMSADGTHRIPMHTFPYEAPEIGERLSEDSAKKTDAYSYGMLVWRCMIDSADILSAIGIASSAREILSDNKLREGIRLLKVSDGLLEFAIHNLSDYFFTHHIPAPSFNLVTSALMFTLRGSPSQRALDRAQVRMRGMDAVGAHRYVTIKDEANQKTMDRNMNSYSTPGRHGIDMDSVGFALGRMGNDYDAQNNLPGFRPDLPRPTRGGFLFEPLNLRKLLSWDQQQTILQELESLASSATHPSQGTTSSELRAEPWKAAYFLFQCYLCGFGTRISPEKACHWLQRAAEPSEEMGEEDYFALAWLNRVHSALGVSNPYDAEKQMENLFWSVVRGHTQCLQDAEAMTGSTEDLVQKLAWKQKMKQATFLHRHLTGATGMPFFAPRKLTREWDLDDMAVLDLQIRQELGTGYDACLRSAVGSDDEPPDPENFRFDRIYVNHKGHGLLHMAALQGKVGALRHIYQKYLCNINLKNQSHGDTPLTCACRSSQFDAVIWCLDNGADPNGAQSCEESPLHCISGFDDDEMGVIVYRLVAAGANLEKPTQASRKDVRGILADWEDDHSITLTPLGRAVLRQSLPAVRFLLKHGASTTGNNTGVNVTSKSPVELAAILTLPDILEVLLESTNDSAVIFDECGMLDAAHSASITPYDPLSLHSRLVRCGIRYKENLKRTLELLQKRALRQGRVNTQPAGKHLCDEILLGNIDVVSSLLDLGHSAEGTRDYRPLIAAVRANNADIFRLLLDRGASLSSADDDNPSLFDALASRPPQSPDGLAIARLLLSEGLIIPPTPSHYSPIAAAILNNDYPLASLLISHTTELGSHLNNPITSTDLGASSTLLGTLVQSQSSSSLDALTYLAQPYIRSFLSPLASVDDGVQCSVLHTLSGIPIDEWNSHAQISSRITQTVLAIFPSPSTLGEFRIHPTLGTAVEAVVRRGQIEVLRALLASPGWREDATGKGAALATELAEVELSKLEKAETARSGDLETVKRRGEIAKILDAETPIDFDTRITVLEGKATKDFVEPEIDRDSEAVNLPVDLSVLTEEKPSGWTDGCEMTAEMSLRIFLKHFRKDNQTFGDEIVKEMGKLFNKRGDDE
ncbi:hypothetical protein B0T16DRAFT_409837 [Cercophora newfieldiana]|uniref:Protein kinase domain-containing protein n=1 Tax=Cercophora newfieldiana TaxID=92897 RepID=A0AA40CUD0_9PEZI|nr:hypothetical protein B0T16DRAFT_409837 [Cercophora newfieldiana]